MTDQEIEREMEEIRIELNRIENRPVARAMPSRVRQLREYLAQLDYTLAVRRGVSV